MKVIVVIGVRVLLLFMCVVSMMRMIVIVWVFRFERKFVVMFSFRYL